jgi:uncharacterized protein (TIGR02246 family)
MARYIELFLPGEVFMQRMLVFGLAVYCAVGTMAAEGQTVRPPTRVTPATPPTASQRQPTAGAIAEPAPLDPTLAAIAPSANAFIEAFNSHDAKAVAALWATDGEYIDESEKRFAGREAIEKEYASFFTAHPKARISFVIDRVRQPEANTMIEEGRAIVTLGDDENASRYTAIHKRVDGKWLMASVRDRSFNTSAEDALNDLDWLVGSWHAEENGNKVDSTCRWAAGKKFLERTYSVTRDGKVAASGVQVIGWNPQTQQLQSWIFTSDGGHSVGIWTPRKNGWAIETRGMLADGTPTQAVNLFTRVDDRAFSWQSVERAVGESALPDTEEVLLQRADSKPKVEPEN